MYTPLAKRSQPKSFTGGDMSVVEVMDRIASVESGGRYDALGPEVTSGMYAGERALGKYQIMPGNLPSWSREALGREVTADEFLASPELQETITRHQMQKNLDKYGSGEDAASVWFTGRPRSEAGGDVADVTGTTNDEYIRRFSSMPTAKTKGRYIPIRNRL